MTSFDFFPDFFLVGAPRCGTTTMSKFLRWHPKICFSDPKETFFFARASTSSAIVDLEKEYLERYFDYDPQRHLRVGEGSVSYLYDRGALELIDSLNPHAKFIAMIRNPMEMVPSFHFRMLYILEEEEQSFERAWNLWEARARGEQLPRRNTDPGLLAYPDIGRHGKHLQQLFELVGRERCHVILHDDLVAEPQTVFDRVLKFVGVEPYDPPHEIFAQPSKGYRYRWLHTMLWKPPGAVARYVDPRARSRGGAAKERLKSLRKRLLSFNRGDVKPRPLAPAMRARLQDHFAQDIAQTGELLGRDLGHWR